ncbi:protein kinase [Gemmatimonadota bacterium]
MQDELIGPYKIIEKLGSGGMGEVWLAEDTRLDRKVALKFLPHFAAQDENEKARFKQEAKAAAKLSHASIAQVFEIGEEDGRLYIVMEYVAGGSLRDQLDEARGKPLPLEKVMRWVEQTAGGLAEAHRQGITHRDIKPDNLMLTDTGQVKITDFGLARLETATRLTAAGSTLGTVNYISPELIQGQDVDHRSDLFSLGATFYELLSGQQVFTGQDANSIYYAILNAPVPPLARYRKDLPEGLDGIIEKLLERDPGRRYQAAAEVATDIRRLLGPTVSTTRLAIWARSAKRTLRRVPAGAWVSGGLILGILAGVIFIKPSSDLIDMSTYQFTYIAIEAEPETYGVWSPDGQKIVYKQRFEDKEWRLMYLDIRGISDIRDIDTRKAVALSTMPNLVSGRDLFWASTSDSIFLVGNDRRLYTSGTQVGLIASPLPLDNIAIADIHPYEPLIASWNRSRLTIRELNGTVRETYQSIPASIDTINKVPAYLRFSPDGSKIAIAHFRQPQVTSNSDISTEEGDSPDSDRDTGESDFGFYIFPWPSNPSVEPYEVFNTEGSRLRGVPSFDWLDDEHVVLAMNGDLWIGNVRNSQLFQILTSQAARATMPSVARSANGYRLLYQQQTTDYDIIRIPFDGSPPYRLIRTVKNESSPSYSQQTGAMAYHYGDNDEVRVVYPSGNPDIIHLDDYLPQEEKPAKFIEPFIISPDGNWLAFKIEGRTSGHTVWYWSISGHGDAVKAFPDSLGEHAGWGFAWSPDSASLVTTFNSRPTGDAPLGRGLAVVQRGDPRSCRTIFQHQGNASGYEYVINPIWSPDGRWIACVTWFSGILLISPDGEPQRQLTNPLEPFGNNSQNNVIVWSRDGSYLYVASTLAGPEPFEQYQQQYQLRGLWKINVESGETEYITNLDRDLEIGTHSPANTFARLSPDGNSFVTTARTWKSDLVILEGFPLPRRLRR